MDDGPSVTKRRSRFWLYAPYAFLLVLAVAWTIGWFYVRQRITGGLDEWLASEARHGRAWTCPDREVGGYPFRIEVICASLSLERPDVKATIGRLHVVAQVYNPDHVIAEASGPLVVTAGQDTVRATWKLLQVSTALSHEHLQRGDLVADAPDVTLSRAGEGDIEVSAKHLETHLRPNPNSATTYDWAFQADGAVVPGLDRLVGGTDPADIAVVLDVTQAGDLPARPLWSELERWRQAGGRVDITRASLAKGASRAAAAGTLSIDDLHRPTGEINLSTVGIGGLLGRFVGGKAGLAAGILGALLGSPPERVTQAPEGVPDPGAPPLRPLPPLKLTEGHVYLGPFAIPGVRLPPLY